MDKFNPNPAPSHPELAVVMQQVAHLQYQMQCIQAQNAQYTQHFGVMQQQLDQQVAKIRQVERELRMYRDKYKNEKDQNEKLKKQIEALKEDIRRQTAQVQKYAQQEAERVKRMELARQNATFTNSVIPSAYKDAPPSMSNGYRGGPPPDNMAPATPTPDERLTKCGPGLSTKVEAINPYTLATVAASFRGLNTSTNNDNRRKVSYNTMVTAPSVVNGSIQNSMRSSANTNDDIFGPPPPLGSRALNIRNQQFGAVELPEDVPGTFAHAEKMLVKYKTREERLTEITNQFEALADVIMKWSDAYVKQVGTFDLAGENGDNSVKLMISCAEPLQGPEAEKWVTAATKTGNIKWLVVAMIWRFLQDTIMRPTVLCGLMSKTMETVVQVEEELRSTRPADIAPSRREKLISMRNKAVDEILAHDGYKAFRASKVKELMAHLRRCMKPLVRPKEEISQTAAATGLSQICVQAWDLFTHTLKNDGIFILSTPGVRDQFLSSSMRLAPRHRSAPFALNGCKIRLCISPGFVFREDTAGNVFPKQLSKPMVLVDDRRSSTAALQ